MYKPETEATSTLRQIQAEATPVLNLVIESAGDQWYAKP